MVLHLNCTMWIGWVFLLLGQVNDEPARLVIDLTASSRAESWIASALEKNAGHDIADFQRLELIDKSTVDTNVCNRRDTKCRVNVYGLAGVDIVMLGSFNKGKLKYALYETWTGAEVSRGSISVNSIADPTALRQETLRALAPFMRAGGLIERKHFILQAREQDLTGRGRGSGRAPVQLAIMVLIAFFVSPIVLVWVLIRNDALEPPKRGETWPWTTLILLGLMGILAAYSTQGGIAFISFVLGIFTRPAFEQPLAILGGMAWGWFLLLNLRLLIPKLSGLERVRHANLRSVLLTWIITSCLRMFLLLFYVPFAIGIWLICRAFDVGAHVAIVGIAPLCGLAIYFWYLTLIDNLALYLDANLVTGPVDSRNPWHTITSKYFLGYVRRNGLHLDNRLLSRLVILPSKRPGITSYGGGLAPPRILISTALLEAAMGRLDERLIRPDRTADPRSWAQGLLVPTLKEAPQNERHERKHVRALHDFWIQNKQRLLAQPYVVSRRGDAQRVFGENATLLGWTLPSISESSVPLVSNTDEDFRIVKELLTSHYAAFNKPHYDFEYDDTDPSHKDFLFGAILREVGCIQRQDTLLTTALLSASMALKRAPKKLQRVVDALHALHMRTTARYIAKLADAYVALHWGRDHLIQYLYLLTTGTGEFLTARATTTFCRTNPCTSSPKPDEELLRDDDPQVLRATPRNRLLWLSRFFYDLNIDTGTNRWRGIMIAFAAISITVWLGFAVHHAVSYQTIYAQRMAAFSSADPSHHKSWQSTLKGIPAMMAKNRRDTGKFLKLSTKAPSQSTRPPLVPESVVWLDLPAYLP
ncbi:MAG: hypothetical protein R3C68_00520 [Myxococcota bacterium]